MFGQIYSHDIIKKYVIFFGSIFNDVYLTRDNSAKEQTQTMKVPLNYGPREKFLARSEGDPDLNRPIAIQLPRMTFEIIGYQYDPDRKLPSTNKISAVDRTDPNKKIYMHNPVPWNLHFQLSILVKNSQDGVRIIEQILPFFSPEFSASLNLNDDFGTTYVTPLILNDVNNTDTYEGDFENRRAIVWVLDFTLKGWIFGPTRNSDIIKQAEVYARIPDYFTSIDEATPLNTPSSVTTIVTPGLTSGGDPTTDPDQTIDKNLINADDNWAFIIEYEETL